VGSIGAPVIGLAARWKEAAMPDLTINGYKHHYEEVGSGEPMIFIAGTRFDSAKDWVGYMERNAKGFRVIMPDLRGMAGSEHTTDVKGEDWVSDLAALLDELGVDSLHVAGETLGTRVVTRFAFEHPERVKTLVLNGAIAFSYAEGDAERSAQTADMPQDRLDSMKYHHGDDALAVNEFYLSLHAQAGFHAYYDLRKIASQVQAPTLLLRGDVDDDRHPIAHSTELHALMPNSWLQIFANTRFNGMTNRPEESWALIRQLFAEAG
jgi:pimeloyl-ACP methyl ester carboxylesterase